MADAPAFEWICNRLEEDTSFDRLEARGTIRLALKSAGLEARSLTPDQLKVVIERILERELTARGIDDAATVCTRLVADLGSQARSLAPDAAGETPDAVFSRLGGGG